MKDRIQTASDGQHDLLYEDIKATRATANQLFRRTIEHVRTLQRKDDLTGLLPLHQLQPLALPGESYKLAFTPGLLGSIYKHGTENLLTNLAGTLGGKGADGGGYVLSNDHKAKGIFPATDADNQWWIPSGRIFYSTDADIVDPAITATKE